MRFCLAAIAAVAFCFAASNAVAARVALVIGNDRYPDLGEASQLRKAVSDAGAVGEALRKLGFTVLKGDNLDRQAMIDRLFDFTQRVGPGDTAVFFFAGHGVAIGGANYLLPTDVRPADIGQEARVRNMAVAEADIVADIQERKADVTLMILDACRDNPFGRSGTRSVGETRGLARVPEATGVFAIYSAGYGQQALDALGPDDDAANSVFTRVLVPELGSDLHLADMVIEVRQQVAELAGSIGHEQNPAYYDQTRGGRIYLAGRETEGSRSRSQAPGREDSAPAPPLPAVAPSDRRGSIGRVWEVEENAGWRSVWTRRGTGDTFDAVNIGPNGERGIGTLDMTIRDRRVTVRFRHPTAACIYDGRLSEDERSVAGSYECNHVAGRYEWRAEISDRLPEAPADDWRGQVWEQDEGGEWLGVWKRRGRSAIFDAEWRLRATGGYDTSVLNIEIDGDRVTVFRHQEKGSCTYKGRRKGDRIAGTFTCTWAAGEYPWRATILE